MATIRQAAVDLMTQLATSGRAYLLAGGRDWSSTETRYVYGEAVSVPMGPMDCSGSVTDVYIALGVITNQYYDTGNMASKLCAQGFIYHDWSDSYVMRPGDLALYPSGTGSRPGHVAMCVDSNFSLAEFTTPSAGGPGVKAFYDYPWTVCLELPDSIANRTWGSGSSGGGTSSIKSMQSMLNGKLSSFGQGSVSVDGIYGQQTQRGLVRLLQASDNIDYGYSLSVDGIVGPATLAAVNAHQIGYGHETTGNDVWAVKAMLVGNGWDEVDLGSWNWTSTDQAALKGHQPYWGLSSTGVCNGATLKSLVPQACA